MVLALLATTAVYILAIRWVPAALLTDIGFAVSMPFVAVGTYIYARNVLGRDGIPLTYADTFTFGLVGIGVLTYFERTLRYWSRLHDVFLEDSLIGLILFVSVIFWSMLIVARGEPKLPNRQWRGLTLWLIASGAAVISAFYTIHRYLHPPMATFY